jgi:glycerate kinase
MLAALGVSLLDANGQPIPDGAQGLRTLARIDTAAIDPAIRECRFRIICDVTNPLCGKNGASYVYGPQKGASPAMCAELDALLARFAELTACAIAQGAAPLPLAETPGAGAAGGLGYAFLAYLNAQLLPGIDVILDVTRLEDYLKDADILLTGEGRLDAQTANGKAPAGAAALAKKHGLKVLAFAGLCQIDEDAAAKLHAAGIDSWYAITPSDMPHELAKQPATAKANMAAAVERVFQREIIG